MGRFQSILMIQMLIISFRWKYLCVEMVRRTRIHTRFEKVMIGLKSNVEFGIKSQYTIYKRFEVVRINRLR